MLSGIDLAANVLMVLGRAGKGTTLHTAQRTLIVVARIGETVQFIAQPPKKGDRPYGTRSTGSPE